MITEKERKLIDEHIVDQRKLRKVKRGSTQSDIDRQIEDLFFFQMDFIKENKFDTDRNRLIFIWDYIKHNITK